VGVGVVGGWGRAQAGKKRGEENTSPLPSPFSCQRSSISYTIFSNQLHFQTFFFENINIFLKQTGIKKNRKKR
jgi:hypothetical protein